MHTTPHPANAAPKTTRADTRSRTAPTKTRRPGQILFMRRGGQCDFMSHCSSARTMQRAPMWRVRVDEFTKSRNYPHCIYFTRSFADPGPGSSLCWGAPGRAWAPRVSTRSARGQHTVSTRSARRRHGPVCHAYTRGTSQAVHCCLQGRFGMIRRRGRGPTRYRGPARQAHEAAGG